MSTDPIIEVFVYENMQLIEHLEDVLLSCEKNASLNKEQIDEVFRVMHTVKGSSGMMNFDSMAKLSHSLEDMFSKIREKAPDESHWSSIFDLVLEGLDFLKCEIEKIQSGGDPDGDISALHHRIEKMVEVLYVPAGANAPAASSAGESKGKPEVQQNAALKYYTIRIKFEENCRMESVRAFGVLTSLKGLYTKELHNPPDIEINCDEEIAINGFTIYLLSDADVNEIRFVLGRAFLVDSYSIEETDLYSTPFADLEDFEPPVQQSVPQVVEEVHAVSEPAQVAAQPAAAAKSAQNAGDMEGKSVKQNFISVNVNKIDKLMNLVGEIVTSESMVTKNPDLDGMHLENFEKQARQLRKLTNELQDVVMSIRMVPISTTFHKMQRIVRDMCKKINREAQLIIIGETTEVDKNVIDNLSDPLMHLIRNSMDHGLETPEERMSMGKDPVGVITLEARNAGGDVIVTVSDDGRGLDKHKIIQKAIASGITTKAEADISDKEAYGFILAPGFSTNEEVTEFSGRGVGMDVVHRNIENIGGTLSVESEPGKGTTIKMHIPLTLAIVDGMRVCVGTNQFIVPILNIRESIEPRLHKVIVNPDGGELAIVRGTCYEILRLSDAFGIEADAKELNNGIMLIVESENGTACLFVDKLVGEQQAVIKPMPAYISKYLGRLKGLAGCSILGNGSISLILDVNSLLA